MAESSDRIGRYFDFFSDKRLHLALGYQMLSSFYDGLLNEAA